MRRLLAAPQQVVRRGLGFGGTIGAVLLFCMSLTPSLLPRHWALQGVVSGVTMAIGYAFGATIGALIRTTWSNAPVPVRRAWTVLGVVSLALAVAFLQLGDSWQREVRELVGAEPTVPWASPLIAVIAAAVFVSLLLAARSIRLATRSLASTLERISPRPVASVAAVGVVAALSYGVGQGVVLNGFVDLAERVALNANDAFAPDVERPRSPYVSGGPGSLVAWETLGAYGREFTAGAVPRGDLASFGMVCEPGRAWCDMRDTREPVRVYAGLESADTVADQADLAVRELERTGGFDRAVLAIVTTTGTGWVNPAVPTALEYLYAGDTATVAIQHSYLPSWISFVSERSTATGAATELIGAVRDRLVTMPSAERPQLVVYGESLGAYGTEYAFGDLESLLRETDGAVLAGPPHGNPIWEEVVEGRDPDSPIWRPLGLDHVAFMQTGDDFISTVDDPKLIYLQNASDPIVWWSPDLLYRKPAWLDGERGPDVSGAMRWFPAVTFWQVSVDMVTSTKAPAGHGHSYYQSLADALALLVAPPDWTDQDTARLRPLLDEELF
jgi:uncharacterized membrane protein